MSIALGLKGAVFFPKNKTLKCDWTNVDWDVVLQCQYFSPSHMTGWDSSVYFFPPSGPRLILKESATSPLMLLSWPVTTKAHAVSYICVRRCTGSLLGHSNITVLHGAVRRLWGRTEVCPSRGRPSSGCQNAKNVLSGLVCIWLM